MDKREQVRRTKIICTLGPAVDDDEKIAALLSAGMNVARFNFSHGTHEEHEERLQRLRRVSASVGIPVATMLDTKGPEIRTGIVADDGQIELRNGESITLTTETVDGTAQRLSVSYQKLPTEIRRGNHIFIADGLIDLEVLSSEGTEIHCIVRNGGTLGSRKNVNVPGVKVGLPAITEKDEKDIAFAVHHGMDFIAASFIRRPQDVVEILNILAEHESPIRVVAKIENQEGLDNLEDIIRVAHGVMVARGDLGVQLATEDIPLAQKRIISACNRLRRPVITATQMLDSMIYNPNPTRAELTDVANAIFDGTDAVMLSGETAGGKFPVRSCQTLDRIARAVERSAEYRERCMDYFDDVTPGGDPGQAMARAAFIVAKDVEAAAIITPTLRGNSPRLLSQLRPSQPIIAVTVSDTTHRQLLLHWGIHPLRSDFVTDSDEMLQNAMRLALESGFARRLDRVVTVAGVPLNSPIPLNTVKVHFLGNILGRGQRGFGGRASGKMIKAASAAEARKKLSQDGTEILLTTSLTDQYRDILPRVRGVVLEEPSQIPPESIELLNPDVVVISEVPAAMFNFESQTFVTLDGHEKIIYEGVLGDG